MSDIWCDISQMIDGRVVSSITDDNARIGQAIDNSGVIGADSQNRTVDSIITITVDASRIK
jgi:hypothetical protein